MDSTQFERGVFPIEFVEPRFTLQSAPLSTQSYTKDYLQQFAVLRSG